MPAHDPAAELLALLQRARSVKLSAGGEGLFYFQPTAKSDGSFGARVIPLEGDRKLHFQAIVNPLRERLQLLLSDENRPEHTAERHAPLLDINSGHASATEEAGKRWLLDMLRRVLADNRVARAAHLGDERFLIVDRDAAAEFLASLPTDRGGKRVVVEVEAAPLVELFRVVDGVELHRARTSGGRIVRYRGQLVLSHIASAIDFRDAVCLMPFGIVADIFPSLWSLVRLLEEAGARVFDGAVGDVTELRMRADQLAHLPEALCRLGVLSRSALGVTSTTRSPLPGITVLPSEAEELLRLVEAEMAAGLHGS